MKVELFDAFKICAANSHVVLSRPGSTPSGDPFEGENLDDILPLEDESFRKQTWMYVDVVLPKKGRKKTGKNLIGIIQNRKHV